MKTLLVSRIVYYDNDLAVSFQFAGFKVRRKVRKDLSGKLIFIKQKRMLWIILADSVIVMKFGIISDSIWNYAELGMQEFKSSAILIKTLEEEGFNVEKGVAGMPTCFVATWGTG